MDGFLYLMVEMTSRSETQGTLVSTPLLSTRFGSIARSRPWWGRHAQGCWTCSKGVMDVFGKQLVGISLFIYQIHKDYLFLSGSISEDGKGEGSNQASDTQLVHKIYVGQGKKMSFSPMSSPPKESKDERTISIDEKH